MIKKIVAQNKKAHFSYFIENIIEAGLVLKGSEVKSLRSKGNANISEAYGSIYKNEVFLYNSHIASYTKASYQTHEPSRTRKLLLHRGQIKKIIGKIKEKGYTIVPISLYFNNANILKVEIGIGKGKNLIDKREHIKKRDWEREQRSLLKNNL